MKILPNNIAILENDSWIGKWIEEAGRLDHDQNSLPRILEHIKPDMTVVDVGAYVGDHTHAYLNAVGETGTVLAFEPNPAAFECLRHNCPRAICMMLALSDENSCVGLHDPGINPGATRLVPGTTVVTGKLDGIELSNVHLIKIDVEGYETKVLRGAHGTIKRFRPILVIEINRPVLLRQDTSPEEVFAELTQLGYTWRNVYVENKCEGEQFDIIAFPNGIY